MYGLPPRCSGQPDFYLDLKLRKKLFTCCESVICRRRGFFSKRTFCMTRKHVSFYNLLKNVFNVLLQRITNVHWAFSLLVRPDDSTILFLQYCTKFVPMFRHHIKFHASQSSSVFSSFKVASNKFNYSKKKKKHGGHMLRGVTIKTFFLGLPRKAVSLHILQRFLKVCTKSFYSTDFVTLIMLRLNRRHCYAKTECFAIDTQK